MISLIQNIQENDQKITMLQLVDRMKVKQKDLGKKIVKLQTCSGKENKASVMKSAKRKSPSFSLEFRLDELRKELASLHGGIFPHAVLSTQQINILALEKIIGKVKCGKYGSRILEEIAHSSDFDNLDSKMNSEQGEKASKKMKTKTAPVLIESSEEEE
ncbi:Mediator of RNA polymerase II transcription subunit 34 [Bienertia sinuspersici]